MKRLVILPLLLALALATCKPHARWHQKLTLVVDTPAGEVSGSSVVRVGFSGKNRIILRDLDSPHLSLAGEAAMVEVLPGRWLFALLPDQEYLIYNYLTDQQADGHIELEEAIPLILDRRQPLSLDLTPQTNAYKRPRIPMLVTFDDITDPMTVSLVDPLNLEASFGPGVSLKVVTAEVTNERETEGAVERVLPWLEINGREQPNLKGEPPAGWVSDQPLPTIYFVSAADFSTELFK